MIKKKKKKKEFSRLKIMLISGERNLLREPSE
jgi:hypothetical protein